MIVTRKASYLDVSMWMRDKGGSLPIIYHFDVVALEVITPVWEQTGFKKRNLLTVTSHRVQKSAKINNVSLTYYLNSPYKNKRMNIFVMCMFD